MKTREYINEEGYRIDGRKTHESRLAKITFGNNYADSSDQDGFIFFEMGNTKVMSYLKGPIELKKSSEKCSVKCEVFLSPFTVYDKKKMKTRDHLTTELSMYIRKTFENIILQDLYKNCEISIFLHVIERDGGLKHAAVNACMLSLVDAGVAVKQFLSSCSVIYVQNKILVDANQLELNSGAPELTIVLDLRSENIVVLEFDSEVPIDIFKSMVETCTVACRNIGKIMKLNVKENALKLLSLNKMLTNCKS